MMEGNTNGNTKIKTKNCPYIVFLLILLFFAQESTNKSCQFIEKSGKSLRYSY